MYSVEVVIQLSFSHSCRRGGEEDVFCVPWPYNKGFFLFGCVIRKYLFFYKYLHNTYFKSRESKMGPPPVVTGISPKEGPPGTRVTIRGEFLGTTANDLIGNLAVFMLEELCQGC